MIYRFDATYIKISTYFSKIERKILNFMWKYKRLRIVNTKLNKSKEIAARGNTNTYFNI